jgi:hypothetical protein
MHPRARCETGQFVLEVAPLGGVAGQGDGSAERGGGLVVTSGPAERLGRGGVEEVVAHLQSWHLARGSSGSASPPVCSELRVTPAERRDEWASVARKSRMPADAALSTSVIRG